MTVRSAPTKKLSLGSLGEIEAWAYLRKNGFKVVEKNFRCSLGELDVVAKKKKILYFIEVKTRSTKKFGHPEEAVTSTKQIRIRRLAEWYLKAKKISNQSVRFAVVSVFWPKDEDPEINFIEDDFTQ